MTEIEFIPLVAPAIVSIAACGAAIYARHRTLKTYAAEQKVETKTSAASNVKAEVDLDIASLNLAHALEVNAAMREFTTKPHDNASRAAAINAFVLKGKVTPKYHQGSMVWTGGQIRPYKPVPKTTPSPVKAR